MQTIQIKLEDEIGFCQSQTRLLDDQIYEAAGDEIYERYERYKYNSNYYPVIQSGGRKSWPALCSSWAEWDWDLWSRV
jgi:hypothetical protein